MCYCFNGDDGRQRRKWDVDKQHSTGGIGISHVTINTDNVLSSNSDEDDSSVQVKDLTELILHVYSLQLNDRNVPTLTQNDKLNRVDNNTDMYEEQNEGVNLLGEPQAISEPETITGEKMELRNTVYCYSITLLHTGLNQKEDLFDALMYK